MRAKTRVARVAGLHSGRLLPARLCLAVLGVWMIVGNSSTYANTFQWPSACTSNGGDILCTSSLVAYYVTTGQNQGAAFNDPTAACAAVPGNAYGTEYRNAAWVADDPNWGTGCYYDLYYLSGTTWVYEGRYIYQNWVLAGQTCPYTPLPYSYTDTSDHSVSTSGRLWCGYTPFYVAIAPLPGAQCSACIPNPVGHPINPATGAEFDSITDLPTGSTPLTFRRFYNSSDTGAIDLSGGWRHSYSRSVVPNYTAVVPLAYVHSAAVSTEHGDPSKACTSGFAEVQSQVPAWAGAIATYSGGLCQLTRNGVRIGTAWIFTDNAALQPTPSPTPLVYDAVRDDGQLVRFVVNGSSIQAPPGSPLTLKTSPSGMTLTDENDDVEQYDSTGRLVSITSRSGFIQTLSYDSIGRLKGVTDSFGHGLTLTYNTQGQLSQVSQQ